MPKPRSKVKKVFFLALFMLLALASTPTFALTITPQKDVRCALTSCTLDVNMSKYIDSKAVTDAKALDLTKTLTATTYAAKTIETLKTDAFRLSWKGSVLTIYADIKPGSANYWTMNVNGVIIDPWFNSSTSYYYIPNCATAIVAYPFDEGSGTTAYDRSDGGNNGAFFGTASWVSGKYDTAVDTTTGGVNIAGSSNLDFTSYFTMMMWVKTTSTVVNRLIYMNNDGSGIGWSIMINRGSDGKLNFYTSEGGGWQNFGGTAVNGGGWTHIAMTYNSSGKVYLFINGSYDAQVAISGLGANTNNKSLGYDLNNGVAQFQGIIDEFKIFNTSLTPAQIVEEMNTPIYYTFVSSLYYEDHLYLNGNESDITIDNATALNATAATNLTGFNVSLFLNGSLIASGINSASSVAVHASGYYNVTAWIGNASTNGTITRWANLTFVPPTPPAPPNYSSPYPLNASWNWCAEPDLMLVHQAIYNNGTFYSANDSYVVCPSGCMFSACNDSNLQVAALIIILVLVGLTLGFRSGGDKGILALVAVLVFYSAFVFAWSAWSPLLSIEGFSVAGLGEKEFIFVLVTAVFTILAAGAGGLLDGE